MMNDELGMMKWFDSLSLRSAEKLDGFRKCQRVFHAPCPYGFSYQINE